MTKPDSVTSALQRFVRWTHRKPGLGDFKRVVGRKPIPRLLNAKEDRLSPIRFGDFGRCVIELRSAVSTVADNVIFVGADKQEGRDWVSLTVVP